jgi:malonyl-CoA O-methyltransferase
MLEQVSGTSADFDPHLDAIAAARWANFPSPVTPWLHDEVGRRMAERLDYIKLPTTQWTNWSWQRGGAGPAQSGPRPSVLTKLWQSLGGAQPPSFKLPADLSQDMVWSNMQLHMEAAPKRVIEAWHRALKTNGFVMFSLLGPDTLLELRRAYEQLGWPAPLHTLTDMHDWGDRLVQHGFAEPVMDMERLTLTFATPERALQELRELGRNLNPNRIGHQMGCQLENGTAASGKSDFSGLRGKAWHQAFLQALARCRNAQGEIALTFELIYGHAIKPKPRVKLSASSSVSMAQMREMLKG